MTFIRETSVLGCAGHRAEDQSWVSPRLGQKLPVIQHQECPILAPRQKAKESRKAKKPKLRPQGGLDSDPHMVWERRVAKRPRTFAQRDTIAPTIQGPSDDAMKDEITCRKQTAQTLACGRMSPGSLPPTPCPQAQWTQRRQGHGTKQNQQRRPRALRISQKNRNSL